MSALSGRGSLRQTGHLVGGQLQGRAREKVGDLLASATLELSADEVARLTRASEAAQG